MDNSVWRPRARILAYIDLFFSILGFIITIGFILLFGVAAATIVYHNDTDPDFDDATAGAVIIILWILVAVQAIFVCIDLWAAIMLLKATKLGSDPGVALRRARIYRNVVIVFLIFNVAFGIYSYNWLGLALGIIIRAIFLYIVCKFIQELQTALFRLPTTAPILHHHRGNEDTIDDKL